MNSYLKWAGSKRIILQHILSSINYYEPDVFIEPFCGALNVGANVDCDIKIINDINSDLMNLHALVKINPQGLIESTKEYFERGIESYKDIREEFNNYDRMDVKKAAMFLYLNRHCFNGLCRYNKNGNFNVPVGSYDKVYLPEKEILDYHKKLANCIAFNNMDFQMCFDLAKHNPEYDRRKIVFYCDPPYVPLTSDFNYSAEGFTIDDQKRLARLAEECDHTVIISNHDTPVTRELYKNATKIISFPVQRTISSKGGKREKVKELLAFYER